MTEDLPSASVPFCLWFRNDGIAIATRMATGITVQKINPGAYDTGFNDRMADTTYHWHDDAVHVTRESDIRTSFAAIMKGQFDPQEMIDKMVEVIGTVLTEPAALTGVTELVGRA